jgi:hypothetical protein
MYVCYWGNGISVENVDGNLFSFSPLFLFIHFFIKLHTTVRSKSFPYRNHSNVVAVILLPTAIVYSDKHTLGEAYFGAWVTSREAKISVVTGVHPELKTFPTYSHHKLN